MWRGKGYVSEGLDIGEVGLLLEHLHDSLEDGFEGAFAVGLDLVEAAVDAVDLGEGASVEDAVDDADALVYLFGAVLVLGDWWVREEEANLARGVA